MQTMCSIPLTYHNYDFIFFFTLVLVFISGWKIGPEPSGHLLGTFSVTSPRVSPRATTTARYGVQYKPGTQGYNPLQTSTGHLNHKQEVDTIERLQHCFRSSLQHGQVWSKDQLSTSRLLPKVKLQLLTKAENQTFNPLELMLNQLRKMNKMKLYAE